MAHAFELEKVNQLAQTAFVGAYAVECVKAGKPAAAEPAAACIIQRGFGNEGRAALDAEGFGAKRFGKGKARRANRKAGKFLQAGAANAAIVGKRKRKSARGGMCGYFVRRRESASGGPGEPVRQRLDGIYEIAN